MAKVEAVRCRHNKYWVIAGGYWLWCYECGAIRKMKPVGNNGVSPEWKRWQKPVGKDGGNPWNSENHT